MNKGVLVYRVLYALVMLLFFANIVKSIRFDGTFGPTETWLGVSAGIVSISLALVVLVFPRNWAVLSTGSLLWVGLFTWFSWWSSASPFRLHEFYSYDSQQNMAGSHNHMMIAGTLFALLCVWFLSLIAVSSGYFDRFRETIHARSNP